MNRRREITIGGPDGGIYCTITLADEVAEITRADHALRFTRKGAATVGRELIDWANPTRRLRLVGQAEIIEEFGISRRQLGRWRAHPEFPKPVAKLRSGLIWEHRPVAVWVKRHRRKPGRPPSD